MLDNNMQSLFDIACSEEIKLELFTDFDDNNQPVFSATIRFDYASFRSYRRQVETEEEFDSPDKAIAEVIRLYREAKEETNE